MTLATFFVLRGANLVFSKRLAGKVTVDGVDDAAGYEFFRKVFASVHSRETFALRDPLFLGLCIAGAALICWSLLEQSLVRRDAPHAAALPVLGVGLVAAIAGLIVLHQTDGVGANVLGSLLGGLGVVATVAGFARWRYEPRDDDGRLSIAGSERQIGLGVGLVALAVFAIFAIDREEHKEVLTWLPSWGRVVLGVVAAVVGLGLAAKVLTRSFRDEESQKKVSPLGWVRIVLLVLVIGLVTMVAALSLAQLVTMQAFRTLVAVILSLLGVLTLLRARGRVGAHSARGQLAVGLLTRVAVVVLAFATRAGSGAERFRSGLFAAIILGAIGIAANTFVEAGQRKRREADRGGRQAGRPARLRGCADSWRSASSCGCSSPARTSGSRCCGGCVATAVASFVLLRTKYGNWIFAVGGNKEAARAIGVPANQVKIGLFVTVSLAGCFVGMMIALRFTSVQAEPGHRPGVRVHHRRRRRWLPADRRLRVGDRRRARRDDHGRCRTIGIPSAGWNRTAASRSSAACCCSPFWSTTSFARRLRRHDDSHRRAPAGGRRQGGAPLLELRNISQVLRQRDRAGGHHDLGRGRQGHVRARRQRRRQVDVHQDPVGRAPTERGRVPAWTATPVNFDVAPRRPRGRHRRPCSRTWRWRR